jgi:hypothetical protein
MRCDVVATGSRPIGGPRSSRTDDGPLTPILWRHAIQHPRRQPRRIQTCVLGRRSNLVRPTLPPGGRRVRNWIGVIVGPFVALAILLLGLDQPKPLFYTLEAAIVFGAWIYMLILLIKTPRTPRK